MNHIFHKILVALLAFSAGSLSLAQEYEFLASKNLAQVQALADDFGLPSVVYTPITGVDAYRMTYPMPFLGDTIWVSGAVFEPVDLVVDPACAHPVHVYMHGTIFRRIDAPSFLSYEGQMGFLMAAMGFTVLMPDYVGLGEDEAHLHAYVHAQSEADAGAWMIDALHTGGGPTANAHDVDQLFISGYSQGGHAAMALHRELQANWPQYPVKASAPGSGPYDITGSQFTETFANPNYSNPSYLAYTAMAWQSVYGNLYTDLSDYFQEPYASELPGLFDGETAGWQINAALPFLTEDFVQPGVLDTLLDEGSSFLAASLDNDVYQWIPEVPLRMYYCTEDEQVFYQNALVAEAYMNENGAGAVEAINLGAYDHSGCAGQAIFGAALWFESLAEICSGVGVVESSNPQLVLAPNPASTATQIIGLNLGDRWTVRDAAGRIVESGTRASIDLTGWSSGLYFLSVDSSRQVSRFSVVK